MISDIPSGEVLGTFRSTRRSLSEIKEDLCEANDNAGEQTDANNQSGPIDTTISNNKEDVQVVDAVDVTTEITDTKDILAVETMTEKTDNNNIPVTVDDVLMNNDKPQCDSSENMMMTSTGADESTDLCQQALQALPQINSTPSNDADGSLLSEDPDSSLHDRQGDSVRNVIAEPSSDRTVSPQPSRSPSGSPLTDANNERDESDLSTQHSGALVFADLKDDADERTMVVLLDTGDSSREFNVPGVTAAAAAADTVSHEVDESVVQTYSAQEDLVVANDAPTADDSYKAAKQDLNDDVTDEAFSFVSDDNSVIF